MSGNGYEITEYGTNYGDRNVSIAIGFGRSETFSTHGSIFTSDTVLASSPVKAAKIVGKDAIATSVNNIAVSSGSAIASSDSPPLSIQSSRVAVASGGSAQAVSRGNALSGYTTASIDVSPETAVAQYSSYSPSVTAILESFVSADSATTTILAQQTTVGTQWHAAINGELGVANVTGIESITRAIEKAQVSASQNSTAISGYEAVIGGQTVSVVQSDQSSFVAYGNTAPIDGEHLSTVQSGQASTISRGNTAPVVAGKGVYAYTDSLEMQTRSPDAAVPTVSNVYTHPTTASSQTRSFSPITGSGATAYLPRAHAQATGSNMTINTIWNIAIASDEASASSQSITGDVVTTETVSAQSDLGTAVIQSLDSVGRGIENTVVTTSLAPVYTIPIEGSVGTQITVLGRPSVVSTEVVGQDTGIGAQKYSSVDTGISRSQTLSPDTTTRVGRGVYTYPETTSVGTNARAGTTSTSTSLGIRPETGLSSIQASDGVLNIGRSETIIPVSASTSIDGIGGTVGTAAYIDTYADRGIAVVDTPSMTTSSAHTVGASTDTAPSTTFSADGRVQSVESAYPLGEVARTTATGVSPVAHSIEHTILHSEFASSTILTPDSSTIAGVATYIHPDVSYLVTGTYGGMTTTYKQASINADSAYSEITVYLRNVFGEQYVVFTVPKTDMVSSTHNVSVKAPIQVFTNAETASTSTEEYPASLDTESMLRVTADPDQTIAAGQPTTVHGIESFKSFADKVAFVTSTNSAVTTTTWSETIYANRTTADVISPETTVVSQIPVVCNAETAYFGTRGVPAIVNDALQRIEKTVVIHGLWDTTRSIEGTFDVGHDIYGTFDIGQDIYGTFDIGQNIYGSIDTSVEIRGGLNTMKHEQDITIREQETVEVTVYIDELDEELAPETEARWVAERWDDETEVLSVDETDMQFDGNAAIFVLSSDDTDLEPTTYQHEFRLINSIGTNDVVLDGALTVERSISKRDT